MGKRKQVLTCGKFLQESKSCQISFTGNGNLLSSQLFALEFIVDCDRTQRMFLTFKYMLALTSEGKMTIESRNIQW